MTDMSGDTYTRNETGFAAIREAARQSSLAWREGVTAILLRWNGLLSLVWFIALAIAAVAAIFIILALGTLAGLPMPASGGLLQPSPLKFIFAAAIYIWVIAAGSHHLLSGLGLVARENAVLNGITKKAEELNSAPYMSRATMFGSQNPFVVTGFDAIRNAPRTATFKLVTAIHADAARDRFDPVNLLVDQLGDQVLGGSLGIRDSQQLGVRLGILGTFIGILLSLRGVNGIMSQDPDASIQIGENINAIVTSLGGAFGTSIAGLLAAILLQILAGSLRKRESDVLERMHRVAASVQGLCLQAARDDNPKKLEVLLAGHRETIGGFVSSLDDNGARIQNAVAELAQFVDIPLRSIQDHSVRLQTAVDGQTAAINHLGQISQSVLDLEQALAASQKQGLDTFAAATTALTGRLVDEIRTGHGRDAQASLEDRLDRLAERQYQAVERMARHFMATMICSGLMLVVVIGLASGGFARLAPLLGVR